MPPPRAALVISMGVGHNVYLNEERISFQFLSLLEGSIGGATPVDDRVEAVSHAVAAHADLNALNGQPSHNLGLSTRLADQLHKLNAPERKALRSLRRKANNAKHVWQPVAEPSLTVMASSLEPSAPVAVASLPACAQPMPPCQSGSSSTSPRASIVSDQEVSFHEEGKGQDFFIGETVADAAVQTDRLAMDRLVDETAAQTEHSLANTVILSEEEVARRFQPRRPCASLGTQTQACSSVRRCRTNGRAVQTDDVESAIDAGVVCLISGALDSMRGKIRDEAVVSYSECTGNGAPHELLMDTLDNHLVCEYTDELVRRGLYDPTLPPTFCLAMSDEIRRRVQDDAVCVSKQCTTGAPKVLA
eukprot:CAMPEP_0198495870 /NCGR_PEP_ID=MMETSP1462-20131121/5465_1 /TAXON_ID=1333877 /ORGANISM="Brandtodinium nutriculum, Strain RCC3387" /LENGTH=360 /DNA_ID=CAMNT_0044224671 /DNA_START=67 /DNA_END=1149 /DNA_ORIENTATION=+